MIAPNPEARTGSKSRSDLKPYHLVFGWFLPHKEGSSHPLRSSRRDRIVIRISREIIVKP